MKLYVKAMMITLIVNLRVPYTGVKRCGMHVPTMVTHKTLKSVWKNPYINLFTNGFSRCRHLGRANEPQ